MTAKTDTAKAAIKRRITRSLWILTIIAALLGGLRVSTQGGTPPILLIVNSASSNQYGPYLSEVLKAEGLNAFTVAQLSSVTSLDINQVVVLAETPLNATQAQMFNNFAAAGGRLIVMRPDASLLGALGLTAAGSSTTEGYFALNQSNSFATGFPNTTMPFHGTAQHYTLAPTAQVLATVYSNASTSTGFPAVVRYQNTITWTYDLPRSVIYTRQGNPANASDRDGQPPYRTTDLFYNAIDKDKVSIPYADVQMRMLARQISDLLIDKMPLPRMWYFPSTNRTLVILTGDSHANPQSYFDTEIASVESYGGRISIYEYGGSGPSPSSVNTWRSRGHEVGMHPSAYQSGVNLTTAYQNNLSWFTGLYGSNPSATTRNHQIEWQGWVDAAKIAQTFGIAMDTSFYTWGPPVTYGPGSQAHGFINGSGQPMHFVDAAGVVVPVYQQVTSLIDEALITTSFSEGLTAAQATAVSQQLINNSQAGDYAAITTQFHVDYFGFGDVQAWATGTMNYARSLSIPMWTAEHWLNYTNARYATTMTNLSWSPAARQLSFSMTVPAGAEAHSIMLPKDFDGFSITSMTVDGANTAGTLQTISGRPSIFYNVAAGAHNLVATYNTPLPTATMSLDKTTVFQGETATLTWSTTNATSVSIDNGIGSVNTSGSRIVSPLVTTTYTLTATNTAGSATAQAALTVIPPAPTVTASVNPTSIAQGDFATLSWNTTNAGTVTIDQGIGTVGASGSRIVSPTATTTYTVTVTNVTGTASTGATLTITPPPAGSSLRFNGSSQRARFNTLPAMPVFTVEGWMKRTSDSGRWETYLSNVDGGYSQASVNVYVDGGNQDCGSSPSDQFAWAYTKTTGGWFIQCSGVTANLNAWHHVAVTRDASNTARIFIDGVLRGTATNTGTPVTTTGAFNLGDAGDATDEFFPGLLDEVRISTVARYTATFTPQTTRFSTDANTYALYHLDEGAGQTLADSSGNGRNGFLGTAAATESSDPTWQTDVPFTPPANSPPTITTQPANQTVTSGQNASFTVGATGAPSPTYQWQVSTNGGGTFTNLTNGLPYGGVTTATLTITSATASLSGNQYRAIASNGNLPNATSNAATLTVNVAPAITVQPTNQTIVAGQNGAFTAAASGTPTPTVQWQVSTNGGGTFTNLTNGGVYGGVTTTTLTLTNVTTSLNNNQYRMVATNSAGTATSTAGVLTVNTAPGAPAITVQPTNQTIVAGQNGAFTADASGTPTPTVQWQVSTNGGGTFTNLTSGGVYGGVTTTTLTLTNVTASLNNNQYRMVATNSAGTATTNAATLTVNVAPAITTQPTNQTVNAGQNATFTAAAATGTPTPTVQWQISTNGGGTFTNLTNGGVYSGVTTNTLTLTAVTASLSNNQYRMVATNSAGTATSNAATLTVNVAPAITTQPTNQTVNAGQNATFTAAAATGTPTPTVQWQISTNGGGTFTNLTNGGVYSGVTTNTLTLTAVTASLNNNQYRMVATNSAGTATSNAATLTVNTAPAITTQPTNQTVNAGQPATFTVVATGTPAPTYQWQVSNGGGPFTNLTNTAPYAGVTTATLTISPTTTGLSGGQYQVVVTNSVGSATSNPATLTVNPALAGGSLQFNGTSQLARFTTLPALTVFTVEGWVKRTTDTGRYETFFANASNGYGQETVGVYVDGGNFDCSGASDQFAWAYTQVGGGWFFQCSGVTATLNTWFHIAVTRDASNTTRIFINGVLRNTIAGTAAPTTSTGAFALGTAGDAVTEFFPGLLDEVRISNVARYSATFTPQTTPYATDASTVALYHLDETSGQTLTDSSGNARNGVLGSTSSTEASDAVRSTDAPVH